MRLLVTTTGKVVTHANTDEMIVLDGADIVIESGIVTSIQQSQAHVHEFDADGTAPSNMQVLDVGGRAIVPGLIDAHTHLIWAGDRSDEVGKRLS
ncbi:MAG: hypothetical protein ACPF92_01570, partial [Candidatus Poseidoniaceae archaeon]